MENAMPVLKEFFTTGEVSKILGISPKTVKNYCDIGKLSCEQAYLTNYRRIPRKRLIYFMQENSIPLELLNQAAKGKKKILIADDNESFVESISVLLAMVFNDAIIETAADGYEACIKAGALLPEVILLDLKMPCAEGFEVCRSIRSSEATKNAKIIVISAHLDKESREKLGTYGVEYMFEKPLRKEKLIETLEKIYQAKT